MKQLHGGDWAGYLSEYGALPLDFSSNVSPLGLPEGVRRAAEAALHDADRYPDPLCRALRRGLSAHHGVPEEQVVCGAGAAELIFRLPLALRPKKALLAAPGFSEYEKALRNAGCAVEFFPLRVDRGFALTKEFLERIDGETDMLFLCEPNNPTGRTTDGALLRAVLRRCAQTGTVPVVDECFNELLDEPRAHTLEGELAEYPNLILLKAFTKSHAMAGLRLGYALCGSAETAARLRDCAQPWAVSGPAQAAGLAALEEHEYLERLHALLREQRPFLAAGLKRLGCRCIPGEANFLLFYHEDGALCEKLCAKGILLRDCRSFPGLSPGWYRAAVRTRGENEAFLKALGEVLSDG